MAEIKYLVNINLLTNELLYPRIHNAASDANLTLAASPVEGQMYMNTTDHNLYVYDGTQWVDLTNQGTGGTDLGWVPSPTTGAITSTTGTTATITLATGTNSGLYLPAHFTLMASIITGNNFGDITTSASGGTWTINAGVVSLSNMEDVGTATVFYRKTAGTGAPEVQTLATLKADLGLIGSNSGDQTITLTDHVTSGAMTNGSFATTLTVAAITGQTAMAAALVGTDEMLISDAGVIKKMAMSVLQTYMQDNLTFPSGTLAGLTDTAVTTPVTGNLLIWDGTDSWDNKAMSGDATISNLGVLTIEASAVELSMMADVASGTIFYRKTAGAGAPEVQTLATLKTDLGLSGTNSGDQTITLTGDVGSGPMTDGSFATTIQPSVIDWGMLNQAWIITQAEGISGNDTDITIPTSAAVKDYVDNAIIGGMIYKGGYDATTDTPSLDDGTPIAGIKQGWTYTVTVAGDFFTEAVEAGDMLVAEIDSPLVRADWTIVNKNISDLGTPGQDGSVTRRKEFPTAAATSTTCVHTLGSRFVQVDIYRTLTPFDKVEAEVILTNTTTCTVNFNVAPTLGEYTIVVIG